MRENGKPFMFVQDRGPKADPDLSIELILRGSIEEFKEYMLRNPQLVNTRDRNHGNVPLHVASSKGDVQLISFLLRTGAHLTIQDVFGNSSLHYATDKGRISAMDLLLQAGANPNQQDFKGKSPIHVACSNNDTEAVKVLLKWNADPEITDFADILPRDKTRSPMIKGLIDRRLQSIHGGDADKAGQSMNWMSFGVGLGVGIGVALAKYQQQANEQLLLKLQDNSKIKRRGNFMSTANADSKQVDDNSQAEQQAQIVRIPSTMSERKFL